MASSCAVVQFKHHSLLTVCRENFLRNLPSTQSFRRTSQSSLQLARSAFRVEAAKKRGFGAPKDDQEEGGESSGSSNDDERVEKIIKKLEKEAKGKSRLKIDPTEAASGKVDFVQVENWGTGIHNEVENLKLKSFSPAFSTGQESSSFYESLAKRLQLMEAKGELVVANVRQLPPFENWNFGEKRYLRYLKNQLAVHCALEAAVQRVLDSKDGLEFDSSSMTLKLFSESCGLYRSKAIESDIDLIRNKVASKEESKEESLRADTQTVAYAKYITQLSLKSLDVHDAATCRQSRLQLLSHVYAIYVSQLSSGMRIGAKAVSLLPVLKKTMAVGFYRDYPPDVSDPLKVFKAAINKAGELLESEEDREEVMAELPKAIQKTSLLLAEIAVEEALIA